MVEYAQVSRRGQITLPATVRERLGIKSGDMMILEDRGTEVAVKPAVVMEVELYTDEQIAQWDAEDKLDDEERRAILKALASKK